MQHSQSGSTKGIKIYFMCALKGIERALEKSYWHQFMKLFSLKT